MGGKRKQRSRSYPQAATMYRFAFRPSKTPGPPVAMAREYVYNDRKKGRYYHPNGKLMSPSEYYAKHPKEKPEIG